MIDDHIYLIRIWHLASSRLHILIIYYTQLSDDFEETLELGKLAFGHSNFDVGENRSISIGRRKSVSIAFNQLYFDQERGRTAFFWLFRSSLLSAYGVS